MHFEDAFELLDSVRLYELKPREGIAPFESVHGTELGFTTVDGSEAATRWLISVHDLKRSCQMRTSKEAQEVYQRMRFYSSRLGLADDIRKGRFSLEERPAPPRPEFVAAEPEPALEQKVAPAEVSEPEQPSDVEDFLNMLGV